jgi:hypothetical protein
VVRLVQLNLSLRPLSAYRTAVTLIVTAVVLAAKPTVSQPTAEDAAPVLLSTKSRPPAWKTLSELQHFAAQGNAAACFELGVRLLEADGVAQDTAQAIALFTQAAQGGVNDATFRLGKIYHDGLGVPVDYPRALDYYTIAAQAGVMEAQHNIGAMLASARGVKRDLVESLTWLLIANKFGDTSGAAAQVRTRLTQRPKNIAAAEARAAELLKDLTQATVRATLLVKNPDVGPPSPEKIPAVILAPSPLTNIAPPKIESPDLFKISLPPMPIEPGAPNK